MKKTVVGVGLVIIGFGFLIALYYTLFVWTRAPIPLIVTFWWTWLYYSRGWLFLIIGSLISIIGVWLPKKDKKRTWNIVSNNDIPPKNIKEGICPACGSLIPEGAVFCGECGEPL